MKLAYLLNMFPLISETFVRKEIEAIEELGQPVERFAARQWNGQLVDPKDIAEQAKTDYLISGGLGRLALDAMTTIVCHPLRVMGTVPLWLRLNRNGKSLGFPYNGGFVPFFTYWVEALALRTRFKRAGIDHFHTHFSTNAATIALLTHHLGGPSYSFTVHGPDELLVTKSLSLSDKMHEASFVVAITNYCRSRLSDAVPESADKVEIVPCGLMLEEFAFDSSPPESAHIVCIGRLCENKGQRHIPAAVAQVKDEFPELVVDLLGGGDDEALIRAEIAKHGVEKQVVMHGWASGDQVRNALRTSRALLLPSYAEGLPIVIMEALAVGRPVLTTRITGIPELVDEACGWLFEPGDVDAIAQALRGAMRASPDQRAAMGAEGRRRIEERHDIRKSARKLLDNFRAAVGG